MAATTLPTLLDQFDELCEVHSRRDAFRELRTIILERWGLWISTRELRRLKISRTRSPLSTPAMVHIGGEFNRRYAAGLTRACEGRRKVILSDLQASAALSGMFARQRLAYDARKNPEFAQLLTDICVDFSDAMERDGMAALALCARIVRAGVLKPHVIRYVQAEAMRSTRWLFGELGAELSTRDFAEANLAEKTRLERCGLRKASLFSVPEQYRVKYLGTVVAELEKTQRV